MDILPIIVIYKVAIADCISFISLKEALSEHTENPKLLIYDNSPEPQCVPMNSVFDIIYFHNKENPGICEAYNFGLELAHKSKINWILLLDQDTNLPSDFFFETIDKKLYNYHKTIACIAPNVHSSITNERLTPKKLIGGVVTRKLKKPTRGIPGFKINSINSGLMISVYFLNSINGFNNTYSLDGLDDWLFRRIAKLNYDVYLLKVTIYHDISIESYEKNVSLKRHKSILKGIDSTAKESIGQYLFQKCKLIKRAYKETKFNDKRYLKETIKYIFR